MKRILAAATDRPWKRVLLAGAALFALWVVLPWLLENPPQRWNITSAGAPFVENDE